MHFVVVILLCYHLHHFGRRCFVLLPLVCKSVCSRILVFGVLSLAEKEDAQAAHAKPSSGADYHKIQGN